MRQDPFYLSVLRVAGERLRADSARPRGGSIARPDPAKFAMKPGTSFYVDHSCTNVSPCVRS